MAVRTVMHLGNGGLQDKVATRTILAMVPNGRVAFEERVEVLGVDIVKVDTVRVEEVVVVEVVRVEQARVVVEVERMIVLQEKELLRTNISHREQIITGKPWLIRNEVKEWAFFLSKRRILLISIILMK